MLTGPQMVYYVMSGNGDLIAISFKSFLPNINYCNDHYVYCCILLFHFNAATYSFAWNILLPSDGNLVFCSRCHLSGKPSKTSLTTLTLDQWLWPIFLLSPCFMTYCSTPVCKNFYDYINALCNFLTFVRHKMSNNKGSDKPVKRKKLSKLFGFKS